MSLTSVPKHLPQLGKCRKKIEENAGCIDCFLPNSGTFAHIWLTKSPKEWTRLTNLPQVKAPQQPNRSTFPCTATAARV